MVEVKWVWSSERGSINNFGYLWLKTVNGFDSRQHCAKCLIGNYSKLFNPRMPINSWLSEDYNQGQLLYFCGVSKPYLWENNLHLGGVVEKGCESEIFAYNGDKLTVINFRQLEIFDDLARSKYPEKSEAYLSCRNFQFGALYSGVLC